MPSDASCIVRLPRILRCPPLAPMLYQCSSENTQLKTPCRSQIALRLPLLRKHYVTGASCWKRTARQHSSKKTCSKDLLNIYLFLIPTPSRSLPYLHFFASTPKPCLSLVEPIHTISSVLNVVGAHLCYQERGVRECSSGFQSMKIGDRELCWR